MKKEKIVTFTINTQNNLNYLKWCVKSLQKNAYYQDFQLLILADECTDGTNEWLKELSLSESRLKYWIHKESKRKLKYYGIGGTLNFLAEKCDTEFFLPLHSDMYVGYHFDKELVKLCKENPKSVISAYRIEPDVFKNIIDGARSKVLRVGTTVYDTDIFGYLHSNFNTSKFTEYSKQFQLLNDGEYRKAEGAGGFIIRKSDWIDNDPLFAPIWMEDMDLWIRMQLKDYKFILTSKSLIWHFAARSSHFPTDDFENKNQGRIAIEQQNSKNWLTKWNKMPENDNMDFVSSKGMKIIDDTNEYR